MGSTQKATETQPGGHAVRQAPPLPGVASLSVEILRADGIKDTATFGTQSPYVIAMVETASMVQDQIEKTKALQTLQNGNIMKTAM